MAVTGGAVLSWNLCPVPLCTPAALRLNPNVCGEKPAIHWPSCFRGCRFNLLKPTSCVHQQLKPKKWYSAHTELMCFVFIWEQTATCTTYSINWLVFITEMKSVYSAVRTGSLNKAVCASSLKPTGHVMHHQQFNIQQLYDLPTLYLCVLYLSENKQRLAPLTA